MVDASFLAFSCIGYCVVFLSICGEHSLLCCIRDRDLDSLKPVPIPEVQIDGRFESGCCVICHLEVPGRIKVTST